MNAVFQSFKLMLSEGLVSAGDRVSSLLPEILLAIVVVFAGWLIAVLVHHIVLWVLNFFAIDKLAAKTPLQSMLKSVGIHKHISDIFGWLVFWMIILLTLIVAADTLHLQQVSSGLTVVTNYIPQVLVSLTIVVFGMLFAKFLQMLTVQTLDKMDISYKKFVGKTVQLVVLVFVFVSAIDQLGFNLGYVLNAIVTITSVALLMLGLGAAFGARTLLDNAIACQQLKRQLPVGSTVEIDSHKGEVLEYTLTNVVIKTGSTTTVLPAVHFLTHTYNIT